MDILAEHITVSAVDQQWRQTLVRACQPARREAPRELGEFWVPSARRRTLSLALGILHRWEFKAPGGIDSAAGRIAAFYERQYGRNEPPLAELGNVPAAGARLRFEVEVSAAEDGMVRVKGWPELPSWYRAFERELGSAIATGTGWNVRHNPVLRPGEELSAPWSGQLLDYSGCATDREVEDLVKSSSDEKILPLGHYAFQPASTGSPGSPGRPGASPLLCLSRYANGGLMAYNGTLVVAPQNSGKTELIVRWALAANQGGYSVFVVDVKGELYRRLRDEGLDGPVMYFTTDPDPDIASDSLNLLDGLDCTTAAGRRRITQLVEAMLPFDEVKDEEARQYWQHRARWIAAIVNLLLLRELLTGRRASLGEVYRVANSESELLELIGVVQIGFSERADVGADVPTPPLRYWLRELSALIHPDQGGARDPQHSYAWLTVGITTLLLPFSEAGVLAERTAGENGFRLEQVNRKGPVTLILAAREQDGEDAKTLLTMVIKRLEQLLYDRRKIDDPTPVLMLLDETRRIRGFQPAEYVTFARDAKAGVVLVYQSITQIEDPEKRVEILENVGTQIYLRSVTGETARQLISLLPVRGRPTFSASQTDGSEGGSESLQTGQEQVPYFSTAELYRLPAGDHPALIYIKDHGAGKPFLVDMHRDRIKESLR